MSIVHLVPNAAKPVTTEPNVAIVQVIERILKAAKTGAVQDLAAVWTEGDAFLQITITPDPLTTGAVVYSLAHTLMTGYEGDTE
jgi:hypothetical protein